MTVWCLREKSKTLADSFSGLLGQPMLFMAVMMIFLLVVGTAMDLTPTILIFGPVCAPLAAKAQETAKPRESTIVVTGEGTAEMAPDMALIDLGVVKDAKTAREALDANNKAMADILAALKEAGIAERDLQTSGFNF